MTSAAGPVRIEVTCGQDVRTTTTGPGESWLAAARRAARADVEPVAVDLSGALNRFAVPTGPPVTIRPMTRDDLPALVVWRAEPHVRRWWDPLSSEPEAVESRYGPRLDGSAPTSMWVWELDGQPIGMVQDYRIADHPDVARLVPDPGAVGGDYLIGRRDLVGRGIGTRCLWSWVCLVRRRRPGHQRVFAAPHHRNDASLRVLTKVGFVVGPAFDEPQDDGTVDVVVGCTLDLETVVGPG